MSGVRRPFFAATNPREMGRVFLTGRPRPVANVVLAIQLWFCSKGILSEAAAMPFERDGVTMHPDELPQLWLRTQRHDRLTTSPSLSPVLKGYEPLPNQCVMDRRVRFFLTQLGPGLTALPNSFYLYFDVCTKRSTSKACLFFNIQ